MPDIEPRVGQHVRPRRGGNTYRITRHRRHYSGVWVWVLVHLRDDRGHGITLERTTEQLKSWVLA